MQLINNTSSSHLSVLETIMSRADEMLLASPFCYTDFSEFADVIACADTIRKIRFITTLKKNEVISKIDTLLSFCQLDDEYGRYLLNKIMKLESSATLPN